LKNRREGAKADEKFYAHRHEIPTKTPEIVRVSSALFDFTYLLGHEVQSLVVEIGSGIVQGGIRGR
jgi:hypothetical protein